LSANTQDLYDGSVDRVVDLEGTLNEVGSGFNSSQCVTGDEEYAMDGLLEFVPPGWFVVIWVALSRLLTTGVAEEFCVGNLAARERTRPFGVLSLPSLSSVVRDPEFLETSAGESDVGAGNWDKPGR
jgi:hypothetical protein